MYENIYAFQAVDVIAEGKKIFALDKKSACVYVLNDMKISTCLELITAAREDETNRYLMWTENSEKRIEENVEPF